MIRVELPFHLQNLARVSGELQLDLTEPATVSLVLDAIEDRYPMLRGTIRDATSGRRRSFLRMFAGSNDWSNQSLDAPLPDCVMSGKEPFIILGAIVGG